MSNTPNILLLVKRLKEFELKFRDVCVFPTLREGERYAGIVLNEEGEPSYHLVVYEQAFTAAFSYLPELDSNLPTLKEVHIILAAREMRQVSHNHWVGKSAKDDSRVTLLTSSSSLLVAEGEFRCLLLRVRRVPV